jgi:hypothetical protein
MGFHAMPDNPMSGMSAAEIMFRDTPLYSWQVLPPLH